MISRDFRLRKMTVRGLAALTYENGAPLFVIPAKCGILENERITSLLLYAEGDRQVGVCSRA